VAHVEIVITDS